MNIDLSREIGAFQRSKAHIISTHGAVWVVFVGDDCKGQFPNFQEAAQFALRTFPNDRFLIRNTMEPPLQVPMVAIAE